MRKLAIGGITFGILLGLAALRVLDLRASRAETLRSAESHAANLALIMSEYLAEAFASTDASLRQLTLHSRRIGGPAAPAQEWEPALAAARAALPNMGALTVVGGDGIVRHSTRPEIVGESRRDDYVVREALRRPDEALIVSLPFPTIGPRPRLIIPIGRRLVGPDGRPEGVLVASFDPALPRPFFRSLDVGRRGTVWVFHPEGIVLFREPEGADAMGERALQHPVFAAARRAGAGTLRAAVEPGGAVQLTAFRTRTEPPLITAVSLDEGEVLAAWRQEASRSAALFVVLALTLAATLFVLFRQMSARAEALAREQRARREAEAANALKDEFLMTVSHELRTPLTAIYGWARMLNQGAVSEANRPEALRTIERNAHAQARLIDDLLDISRVMGGKLRLDVRDLDVAGVVRDAAETLQPAADARHLAIDIRHETPDLRVVADPERLQQIVWNLLSNAVKFTPPGGRVSVTTRRVGDAVEIAVSDTGAGISSAFLPHVFDRFRQEDGGTTRRHGGLGLGLAIVRSLTELHGGTVTARSDGAGAGATFTVRLPAAPAARISAAS